MNVRYRVELSQAEREQLNEMLSGGKHAARKLKRAQILLAADSAVGDAVIAASVSVGESTVYRTKRRFVEGNLDLALSEETRPGSGRKLTGKEEALLIATACSSPPEGRARWTLELLAGEMARRTEHAELSRETVRRRLKENKLKPWQQDMWCIPQVDGTYVARMEDVLDLYAEKPDPKRPVVCFDESPTQLIGEVRQPIAAAPGQPRRYDYEYRRNGTMNLFVFLDAHRPWRTVKVTEQRTALDFAECMRDLVDKHYHMSSTFAGTGSAQGQITAARNGASCGMAFEMNGPARGGFVSDPQLVAEPPHGSAAAQMSKGAALIFYKPSLDYVGPDRFVVAFSRDYALTVDVSVVPLP